ncbi:MAG TPA: alpha-ketoacid dehydrogenase subunit beta, partial [Cytophagales bacterium]|nr:alpha-ketoacid dehydrogenase subunit beta [Cytophagales bacterium]
LETWSAKDPLHNYEAFLLNKEILSEGKITYYSTKIKMELDNALEKVSEERTGDYDLNTELNDVFTPFVHVEQEYIGPKSSRRLIDAIREALDQSLEKHPNLVLMGQDIAEFGGVFKATEGLVEKYGKARVRNTPLCESAIVGTAVGLSINGYKAMVEMQFADFVSNGFNQIVNNVAKLHYRTGLSADVVIRMPTGAGTGAGPFHSQSNEAWFTKVPGLKIIYPSGPYDAKGLLNEAFNDPNPILFFEHKVLYRSIQEEVPEGYYTLPFGKAKIYSEGTLATVITYGMGVHWAMDYKKATGLDIEILDLVSLVPLDYETIKLSVTKTGKVLLLTEDTLTGSIISDIAAWIGEHIFNHLDAPVFRVGSLDTPVPFNKVLEENFLPRKRFEERLAELLSY